MEQIPKEMKENLFKKGHELFLILHSNCNFQFKLSSYHQTGWGLKAKMRSVIKNTVSVIQYKTISILLKVKKKKNTISSMTSKVQGPTYV